jgi:hypothetical protein
MNEAKKCVITLPANPSMGPTFGVVGPATIVGPFSRWEVGDGDRAWLTTVSLNDDQSEYVVERDEDGARLSPVYARRIPHKAVVGYGRKVLVELLEVLRSGTTDSVYRAETMAELYLDQEG